MVNFVYLTLIVVLIGYWLSSRVTPGVCPAVKTVQKFEPKKYMGKWYEIQKYPMIWQSGQKCATATYSLNPNGTVNVHNEAIFKFIDQPVGIHGLATPSKSSPSQLTVKFGYFPEGGYSLLDTDYTSYALVYNCRQLPVPSFLNFPLRLEYSWILSRTPTLDKSRINTLTNILIGYKSNTKQFFTTDQTNCPKN